MNRHTAPTSRLGRARAQGLTPEPSRRRELDHPIGLRLLRFPDVRQRTGLSRSTVWRLERRGEFPKAPQNVCERSGVGGGGSDVLDPV